MHIIYEPAVIINLAVDGGGGRASPENNATARRGGCGPTTTDILYIYIQNGVIHKLCCVYFIYANEFIMVMKSRRVRCVVLCVARRRRAVSFYIVYAYGYHMLMSPPPPPSEHNTHANVTR